MKIKRSKAYEKKHVLQIEKKIFVFLLFAKKNNNDFFVFQDTVSPV